MLLESYCFHFPYVFNLGYREVFKKNLLVVTCLTFLIYRRTASNFKRFQGQSP